MKSTKLKTLKIDAGQEFTLVLAMDRMMQAHREWLASEAEAYRLTVSEVKFTDLILTKIEACEGIARICEQLGDANGAAIARAIGDAHRNLVLA